MYVGNAKYQKRQLNITKHQKIMKKTIVLKLETREGT